MQPCKFDQNSSLPRKIINSPLTNENYYPMQLSLEGHILNFALKGNIFNL